MKGCCLARFPKKRAKWHILQWLALSLESFSAIGEIMDHRTGRWPLLAARLHIMTRAPTTPSPTGASTAVPANWLLLRLYGTLWKCHCRIVYIWKAYFEYGSVCVEEVRILLQKYFCQSIFIPCPVRQWESRPSRGSWRRRRLREREPERIRRSSWRRIWSCGTTKISCWLVSWGWLLHFSFHKLIWILGWRK